MTIKTLTGIAAATFTTVVLLVLTAAAAVLAGSQVLACAPGLTTTAAGASTQAPTGDPVADTSAVAGCADGGRVLARAATWLTAWSGGPVPYESSTDPATWFAGYRRDCSGFASMALGLPGPGLDTTALASQSTPIPKAALRAGDLLINPAAGPAGHVVVFERWANPAMTSYMAYEQSGDGGTHHRVIPYPYFGGYPMAPYRL
jgi:hypothetical protein